jgi:tetratricopeptide (TPR) repeat protein
MQTQDAPTEFLFKLWPWLEANAKALIAAVVAIAVVISVCYFVSASHAQREITAGEALTQLLLTPPTTVGQSADALLQLAAKYNGTGAAQRAELQGAASLFAAGRYPEAQTQFEKFVTDNSSSSLLSTAQLGVGASLEAQGKLTEAATAYQKVARASAATPSSLSAYCALGRIAESQGKLNEAASDYQQAAEAGAIGGTLAQSALFSLQSIKARQAAAQAVAPKATPSGVHAATSASNSAPAFVFPSK